MVGSGLRIYTNGLNSEIPSCASVECVVTIMEKFQEDLLDDLAREYLEQIDNAAISPDRAVTIEQARAMRDAVKELIELEKTMLGFIGTVMTREPSTWRIIMNTKHLKFLRAFHQQHQKAGLYKGGNEPALLGVPITIDESVSEPQLE